MPTRVANSFFINRPPVMPSPSDGQVGPHVLDVAAPADDRQFSGLGSERHNDPTRLTIDPECWVDRQRAAPQEEIGPGGAVMSDACWPGDTAVAWTIHELPVQAITPPPAKVIRRLRQYRPSNAVSLSAVVHSFLDQQPCLALRGIPLSWPRPATSVSGLGCGAAGPEGGRRPPTGPALRVYRKVSQPPQQ